jgi:hypothetical protein
MTMSEELAPRHSQAVYQQSLFTSTIEEFIASMFVSVDEMVLWQRKGWLSFNPLALCQYDEKEKIEVQFVIGLARSGLSDAMINRILSTLKTPYCYDPSSTFFSFVENSWISLPLEQDQADTTRHYLDELIENQDWDALRALKDKIFEALQNAESASE